MTTTRQTFENYVEKIRTGDSIREQFFAFVGSLINVIESAPTLIYPNDRRENKKITATIRNLNFTDIGELSFFYQELDAAKMPQVIELNGQIFSLRYYDSKPSYAQVKPDFWC